MLKLIIYVTIITLFYSVSHSDEINLPKNASGWTIFTPSSDSRIIYVSASGNDATCVAYAPSSSEVGGNPFEPTGSILPCATYGTAWAKTRQEYPDWVLMKRGDTFTVSGTAYPISPNRGRSETAPSLLGAYGSSGASPLIKIGSGVQQALRLTGIAARSYIAISGIDFYAYTRNPADPGYVTPSGEQTGLFVYNYYYGLLIEGCKFRFFDDNIIDNSVIAPIDGLVLRRNIFSDNYAGTGQSHSQGLLLTNQNAKLEENIFIHNGWLVPASQGVGEATFFNHNVYTSSPDGANYTGNIFIQGSNMNAKFTADTYLAKMHGNQNPIILEDNLYIDGQQGIGFGNNTSGNIYPFANVSIKNNIFTNIGKSKQNQLIAWGIDFGFDTVGALAENNLLINQADQTISNGNFVFAIQGIQTNLTIQNNIAYNYKNGDFVYGNAAGAQLSTGTTKTGVVIKNNKYSTPQASGYFINTNSVTGYTFAYNIYYGDKETNSQFRIGSTGYSLSSWQAATGDNSVISSQTYPDPTRDIDTYMASIGETSTIEAFIAKCRNQDRYSWDTRITAPVVNAWIKAGFGMSSASHKYLRIKADGKFLRAAQ